VNIRLGNRGLVAVCVAVVLGMCGLVAAAKPLYDAFCKLTGYGGETQTATAAPDEVLDRTMEIRFDSNVSPGAPLHFKPEKPSMTLRIGESGLAFFKVKNVSEHPVTAVATYNVTPHVTGVYFQKLECFCFRDTVFQPGEEMELPVLFFVHPDLVKDRDTDYVKTITLSYTFYEKAGS
jgi:cytochrome c oxidase assembly protein subunit 11